MGPITLNNDCLICLRRFENQAKLERHCQLSDLHKTSLQRRKIEYKKMFPDKNKRKTNKKKAKTVTFDLPENDVVPEKTQRKQLLPVHLQHLQMQHDIPGQNNNPAPEYEGIIPGENNYSAVAKKRLQERWTKMDWTKT